IPSSLQPSTRPRIASVNCHITPGSSGEPKFRQSVTAAGRAPVVATLRYDSASASFAPVYGSSLANRPLQSVDTATPRPLVSSTRIMPLSSGCASTELPSTYRSYWSVTQDLSHRFGEATSFSRVSRRSTPLLALGNFSAAWACRSSCQAGRSYGRSYTGPSCATVRGGTSTTRSPCQSISSRPVSVTSPITSACTSHFAQIFRNASTFSGVTTAIMRSCDSLIRISSGASDASRSGTLSSDTCIPPSPALASSEVAQDRPAPPRSWIPSTTRAWNSSSVHSISSFSMNGSPTWTAGRLVGPPSANVSLASTDTPPIPSPPVFAPYRMIWLPTPRALARCRSSCRMTPTQSPFTSGLPRYVGSKTTSPPIFGRPRLLP